MRILHAPTNVANQAWAMARGSHALGHHAEVWHYLPNEFDFPADRIIDVGKDPARVVATMFEALDAGFDVFHFHIGRSLVRPANGLPLLWDLPLLRALGKTIVYTFHGVDVRHRAGEPDAWSKMRFGDAPDKAGEIATRLAVIRTYAHRLTVLSALNLSFVPDAVYVPKAIDLSELPAVTPARRTTPLVVHAPSSRGRKGTEFVVAGIEELGRRGLDVEFRLLESLPHAELLRAYAEADVVVDNVIFGDYEVSTLEAMALGKPVVTRIRDEVRAVHPDLPAVAADPDTFVDRMTELLRDADQRGRAGAEGRAYVERTHAAEAVAARLLPLYQASDVLASPTRPDLTDAGEARRLEEDERRIRTLEAEAGRLQEKLRERATVLRSLKASYGGHRPLKILREAGRRRWRR